MTSREIRKRFLDFFQKKEHQIVPSAPLVVKDDPTLMFTNAGMNQFKDFFLGTRISKYDRVADTQKCLRVSGKHNDLEEVGVDTYHHTMFEMLGNWSFGDYFKKDAILWAWELLTEVYGLPKEKLYVTVFAGEKSEGLEPDNEAFNFWKDLIPEERILFCDKKDNFWEMGSTGPCGPCSEVHMDLRTDDEISLTPGHELVNKDHPQVIEIWNLVFIQFNRKADGGLESLPSKHVDTGMGLERLVRAIQNKHSNYDTDLFRPLIEEVEALSGTEYGKSEVTDIAIRVIVDHVRAIAFSISDGQLPSNNGAGYVIRRILRRAVRYGFNFLGLKQPFLVKLIPVLAQQFKDVFPEIEQQKEFVSRVIQEEEISFLRTLEQGIKRIEQVISQTKKESRKVMDGKVAFELYDTYGFPSDLTELIARESNLTVDMDAFNSEMKKQKERSKADAQKEAGDWVIVNEAEDVKFVGYDQLETKSNILRYRTLKQKGKDIFQVVLDITPFYAESGGQVGDRGIFVSGDEKISVLDTVKENDLIVHLVNKLPENPEEEVVAKVDHNKRKLTMNNHSATHLLHAALREVLGDHVEQRGSLVNDKLLRFDFSHFSKMTDEEIEKVEDIVNHKILENIEKQEERDIPLEEAKKKGAMALFGEKYGDKVRVITFDPDYSVELCGGTHVNSTGDIGLFKIISESSIAAGIRRIEAISASRSMDYVRDQEHLINEVRDMLNNPKDIKQTLKQLIEEKKELEKELEKLQADQAGEIKRKLLDSVTQDNGISKLIARVDIGSSEQLKNLAFQLRNEVPNLFMVLGAVINEKPIITIMIADELVKEKGWNAGSMVKELGKEIQGGGGGQAFYATAGGRNSEGLEKALQLAEKYTE